MQKESLLGMRGQAVPRDLTLSEYWQCPFILLSRKKKQNVLESPHAASFFYNRDGTQFKSRVIRSPGSSYLELCVDKVEASSSTGMKARIAVA